MTTGDHDLLEIRGLHVSAHTRAGTIHIVKDVDLKVGAGQMVAVIGESGSGKTTTVRAALGLLETNVRVDRGSISFRGEVRWSPSRDRLREIRGRDVGMVFQSPTRSLNPVRTVKSQLRELLRVLRPEMSDEARQARTAQVMREVGFADPERVSAAYPHQLSGGMCQRVGIALAMATKPSLLVADEPTSALDVTTQAEVVALLRRLVDAGELALLFVTHDLMLAAELCDRIVVMHAGQIVEEGPRDAIINGATHPYTQSLIAAIPKWQPRATAEAAAPPALPAPAETGCAFRTRCPFAMEACAVEPELIEHGIGHRVRCHLAA